MKKEDIIYVTAQPDVPYFHWQIELYVHNFISLGIDPNSSTIKYIEVMKSFIK